MNKKLYSLVLGAAGLGCTTTEYTPADLSDMLADGNISLRDVRAFDSTTASLRNRLESLESKEKQNATVLLNDIEKIKQKYNSGSKIKVKLSAGFHNPAGLESSIDGTENSGLYVEMDYKTLAGMITKEKADELVGKMLSRFRPTDGRRDTSESYMVRLDPEVFVEVARMNPRLERVVRPLFISGSGYILTPDTLSIFGIEDAGVNVTPEFVNSLTSFAQPAVEETPRNQ